MAGGGNGIVVIGAVFVDIKGYPVTKYIPGGRNAGRVVRVHGGVSRNVAEDIANIELRPTFVTAVEDDGVGTEVVEKLKRHKVNTEYIRRMPDGMGTWLAIFDNSGDVVASISRRPDTSILLRILEEQGDEIVSRADAIAVEVDVEDSLLNKIFRLAEKYDKRVYGLVSNMTIAVERRDLLRKIACFVCNEQEAELLFSEELKGMTPEELAAAMVDRVRDAKIAQMVVTLGDHGAVYAAMDGNYGYVPPVNVDVVDTTGCGDAFFAGVCAGLTYGKDLREACTIGTRLAASVIATRENVCPRFLPAEFGLEIAREEGF